MRKELEFSISYKAIVTADAVAELELREDKLDNLPNIRIVDDKPIVLPTGFMYA